MDQIIPYLVGAIFLLVFGMFIYRLVRFKSLRGVFFNAPVLAKVGEIECDKQGRTHLMLRVHILGDNESQNKAVGLELVTKGFGEFDMSMATLTATQARALAVLLERAASGRDFS